MISYQEALDLIYSEAQPLDVVELALQETLGVVAAKTVHAPVATPLFDNSAMDGFAVRAVDTVAADESQPVLFNVMGTVAAGDPVPSVSDVAAFSAWEIMTGAPMPKEYDAVVRVEDVEVVAKKEDRPTQVRLVRPVTLKENVRQVGEDFKANDPIVPQGVRIRPKRIMGLASVGVDRLAVYRRPRVAVVTTGKELAAHSDALQHPGQIYNANAPYLLAMLEAMNVTVHCQKTIVDDRAHAFLDALEVMMSSDAVPDIILSTGAVSAGAWDFVPEALKTLGAKILFHKAKIRPGKPILFARLPKGAYFFGLPGNPIAAAAGLRFFVTPLLRCLQEMPHEKPLMAKLQKGITKKAGFRFFYKAHVEVDSAGCLQVALLPGQESFKINPLLSANCWAVLEEGRTEYEAGESLAIYPLHPEGGFDE